MEEPGCFVYSFGILGSPMHRSSVKGARWRAKCIDTSLSAVDFLLHKTLFLPRFYQKDMDDNIWLRPAFQKQEPIKSWRLRPAENITKPLSISSQNARALGKTISMVNSDWHDFSLEFLITNDSNTYICTTPTTIPETTLPTITSGQPTSLL